jgi:tetratricopeptide (TPR) repeat protein
MALFGLLVLVAGLCLGPVQESDLFFRLASGEQFLQSGHILHRNLFSFTFPDAPYEDPAWLFDAAVAAVHRVGGFAGVTVAKTLLLLGAAIAAYRICRRRGATEFTAALVLGLAFLCMRERLVERPHVVSLLGETLGLGLLTSDQGKTRARGRIWLVLPIIAIWANLHAGAFVGTALLALFAAGDLLDGNRRESMRHSLLALCSAVALLATPIGFGIFRYLAFHVGLFDVHPVDEFRPLTWRSDAPFVVFAVGAVLVLAGSWARARRCATATPSPITEPPLKPKWRDVLPALGMLALAAWHVRFTADALLVAAITIAPALSSLLGTITQTRLARPALVLGFLAVALSGPIAEARHGGRPLRLGLDESALPLDAIHFVTEHGLRERMYNDFETGSYLLWQGFPRYRVFVDPRLPAYPLSFHALLGRMDISRAEWDGAMASFGVDSALLDYAGINRRVAFWDPERWALVFRAKDSRVFVRRLPKWKDLIARREIPATFDFTVENGAVTVPLAMPPAASPVPSCEWQLRLGDLFFDLDGVNTDRAFAAYRDALAAPAGCLEPQRERAAATWMGSIEVTARRFEAALPLLERALAIAPNDTAVLTNKALSLENVGRTSEARTTWERIAALAAGTELGNRATKRASSLR